MSKNRFPLTTLTFRGPRFDDHGLELGMLGELISYRRVLVETAKELWRKRNPDRERLPRGLEESIAIKFYELKPGSTGVPLERIQEFDEGVMPFEPDDEINEAVRVTDAAFEAARHDAPPPQALPATVIPFLEKFGESLREGESIELLSTGRDTPVSQNPATRRRIAQWIEKTYEDAVELSGEVRATDLDGCQFTLRLDNGAKVPGRFDPSHEHCLTEALKDHEVRRLRLTGRAEFRHADGSIKRIISIDSMDLTAPDEQSFDPDEKPFWEVIQEIGDRAPSEEWKNLPSDLSERVDDYLYGDSEAG